MNRLCLAILGVETLLLFANPTLTIAADESKAWEGLAQKVAITASSDGREQLAFFSKASGKDPRPLLVALHSWSGNYTQRAGTNYLLRCLEPQTVNHG